MSGSRSTVDLSSSSSAPGFHVFSIRPAAGELEPDANTRQYTTRRSHTKSRLGCSPCKTKRVKVRIPQQKRFFPWSLSNFSAMRNVRDAADARERTIHVAILQASQSTKRLRNAPKSQAKTLLLLTARLSPYRFQSPLRSWTGIRTS